MILPFEKWSHVFLGPWLLVHQFIEMSNQREVNGEAPYCHKLGRRYKRRSVATLAVSECQRRTVGRLCSTAPRKCKNRYHEKPLYMTQIILKDYIIMNIGDFKPLVSYFMPIIGPKVTKVGPKSSLKRHIYV